MKLVILLALAAVIVSVVASDNEGKNCKCFEEFEPSHENGEWLCRGKKNHRIFKCGEEKPPVCKCSKKGQEVVLDIGETACTSEPYDSIYCQPSSEWDPYLNKHPERRIYH